MAYLEKVTAFITRNDGQDLLLIQHPHAGIQLPAGTVEEGESPERAVLREAHEETGLEEVSARPAGGGQAASSDALAAGRASSIGVGLRLVQFIGLLDEVPPEAQRLVLHRTPVYSRPDPASSTGAGFDRGMWVQVQRHESGFVQATYAEPDRFPDPEYTTYQVTGWVPESALCAMARRYFYHLELAGPPGKQRAAAPDRWSIYADNHIFQLFWAPFSALPVLVHPQETYLAYVRRELKYSFY